MSLDPPILDLILHAVGVIVALLGVVMAYCTLFRDRSRGRRRCPKCWYDMAGTSGLLCPECGRTAKRERSLFRTRRRWGRGVVAAIVLLLGTSFILAPKVRRDGWPSIVPTSVLVLSLPSDRDLDPQVLDTEGSFWAPVSKEIAKRAKEDRLSNWEWGVLLKRVRLIRTRERWPVTEPLRVAVAIPEWLDIGYARIQARLPEANEVSVSIVEMIVSAMLADSRPLDPMDRECRYQVGVISDQTTHVVYEVILTRETSGTGGWSEPGRKICECVMKVPVQGVRTIEEALPAEHSKQVSEALRRALGVKVLLTTSSQWRENALVLFSLNHARLDAADMRVSIEAEIVHVPLDLAYPLEHWAATSGIYVGLVPDPSFLTGSAMEGWFVRVRGIQGEALYSTSARRFWAGQLDIPLFEVVERDIDKAEREIRDIRGPFLPPGRSIITLPTGPIGPPAPSPP